MSGNITILLPKEKFLKVAKGIVFNEDVDALSLGVYVKVIALGRDWNLNVHGLAAHLGLSVDKVKKSFAVLEKAGYLRRNRVKGEGGKFIGWDYEVSYEPLTDHPKNRPSENSELGKNRPSENDPLYIETINVSRDNNIVTKDYKGRDFVPPSVEAVKAYANSIGFAAIDAKHFCDYYEAAGWKKPNGQKMTNWKQFVVTWRDNAKRRGEDITIPSSPVITKRPNVKPMTLDL